MPTPPQPTPETTAPHAGTKRPQVHAIVGTRPEAVKLAPVALAAASSGIDVLLVDTGQQPGRVAQALAPFGLSVHSSLAISRESGSLAELVSLTSTAVERHLLVHEADGVLVQGDTTTAFVAGLTAFGLQIPVAHLEAGLRSGDLAAPFPEEANRSMLGRIARLHLPPTPLAAANLAAEGISGENVIVAGNTVVDALEHMVELAPSQPVIPGLVVVTVHRRESWGAGISRVCAAIRTVHDAVKHSSFVVVTHPNPAVADAVRADLEGLERVQLFEPLPYDELLSWLRRAEVALTDSGGIQEEAPTLNLPTLVAREVTERPEAVMAGRSELVGTDPTLIVERLTALLTDESARAKMQGQGNPFGDGQAGRRTVQALAWMLGLAPRPTDWASGSDLNEPDSAEG